MRKKVFNSFVLDSFEQCLSERNKEQGLLISGNIFQRKHWNILIFKVYTSRRFMFAGILKFRGLE
jgi:hypothetical protein